MYPRLFRRWSFSFSALTLRNALDQGHSAAGDRTLASKPAIETAKVIEELIQLAEGMREATRRGEDL